MTLVPDNKYRKMKSRRLGFNDMSAKSLFCCRIAAVE